MEREGHFLENTKMLVAILVAMNFLTASTSAFGEKFVITAFFILLEYAKEIFTIPQVS